MTSQSIRESFIWAMKETLRRSGRAVSGQEHVPQGRRFWYIVFRCAAGVCLFLGCWLVLALFSYVHLVGALAATALVLVAERMLGLSGPRSEYLLSRLLLRSTGNQDYDSQIRQGLFLVLCGVRLLCVFGLCWTGNLAWFAVALPLAGCAELDVLDGRPAAKARQWKTYGYWYLAGTVALLAAGVWASVIARHAWLSQFLLTAVLAVLAPVLLKGLVARLPDALPQAARRGMLMYVIETALLLAGILFW